MNYDDFFFHKDSPIRSAVLKVLLTVSKQEPSQLQSQLSFSFSVMPHPSVRDLARRLIRFKCFLFARRSRTVVLVPVVARTINKAYIFIRHLVIRLYSALVTAVVQCSWIRVLGTEVYKRKESLTWICCEMTNNNDTCKPTKQRHQSLATNDYSIQGKVIYAYLRRFLL